METKTNEAFQKVINTIKSVKTEEQFYVAKHMVKNFFVLFNTNIDLLYFYKIMDVIGDKMEGLNFIPFNKFIIRENLLHTFFEFNPNPKK